ncbi:MAG: hypothetical protein BWY84_00705 [Candidatus Aerophobetes bacterium ADurb.Bin490]|nr:MAG: hypothetical protein BWY84_00705 [Candidatus Aerophobetes bacterium ADurb.Bin490]HPN65187.1 hypothetical protein [Candidatus Goldiibacteriota bacterium]HRQ43551.1 hypothetical protein [Candidatus Goldiibacteriota bacterium]
MKKTLLVIFAVMAAVVPLSAGDIANTVAVDTLIGFSAGAAIGNLTAIGPYSEGSNIAVFGAGGGIGALAGAGAGLAFGIWHAVYNAQNKAPERNAGLNEDINVCYEHKTDYYGIRLTKSF